MPCSFGSDDFHQWALCRDEDDQEGVVLQSGSFGMRLKAMQYWRCAEVGLTTAEHPAAPASLMIVTAESLPEQECSSVETFLRQHGGEGVEHIALHTPSIVRSVEQMVKSGVKFRHPPPAYYTRIGKLQEIEDVQEDISQLSKLGILLDSEADPEASSHIKTRYLMQIFSHPVFREKSYFFEVIQRCGARGLGSGNIKALADSISQEERKCKEIMC
ncbi:HPDL [Cordylochernes scorpioides]|uniref:HPDL n=1 Tax=Cordylochernes scorpioides TaxID=51811 RepID=A0ABY6JVD7_9ARAC|nr:HPDL [Cordylochernes scorpioides]